MPDLWVSVRSTAGFSQQVYLGRSKTGQGLDDFTLETHMQKALANSKVVLPSSNNHDALVFAQQNLWGFNP
jgi:hypothetical protein